MKLVEWAKSMNWRIQLQNSLLKLRHVHENKLLMNNSRLVVSVREKNAMHTGFVENLDLALEFKNFIF